MEKQMFCFQCEQTAGCSGCTGKAGVWISHCQAGSLVFFSMEYEAFFNDFTDLTGHRNITGDKRRFSHIYLKLCGTTVQALYLNGAGHGFNVKFLLCNISLVHQIFGKNTHTVSTDGRFTSICIKNTHTQFSVNFHRTIQHTVCAQTQSSLAEKGDLLALKLHLILLRVQN